MVHKRNKLGCTQRFQNATAFSQLKMRLLSRNYYLQWERNQDQCHWNNGKMQGLPQIGGVWTEQANMKKKKGRPWPDGFFATEAGIKFGSPNSWSLGSRPLQKVRIVQSAHYCFVHLAKNGQNVGRIGSGVVPTWPWHQTSISDIIDDIWPYFSPQYPVCLTFWLPGPQTPSFVGLSKKLITKILKICCAWKYPF